MIAETAKIFDHVEIGKDVLVEEYCVIGGFSGRGTPPITSIGDGAVIRSHTVIYAGNIIGKDFQTGNKANIRENNRIGDNVSIGTLAVVEHSVQIGNGVRVHSQAFIPEYSVLEDNSWVGPNVVLTNAKYPMTKAAKSNLRGPTIQKGARIGANSTLLPGVVIGRDSIVGAGSVVTRDVAPGTIVAGNPARFIRELDSERS